MDMQTYDENDLNQRRTILKSEVYRVFKRNYASLKLTTYYSSKELSSSEMGRSTLD